MSAGRVYVLERGQRLELPVQRAFEFYAQARNLAVITPPWMGFEVITPGRYRDAPRRTDRLPPEAAWCTRPLAHAHRGVGVALRFIDVQVRGPYALWEHTHTFEPDGEHAVLIGDRVRYAMPLGLLGQMAHAAFVKRDLKRVFDYRERAVAERLQPAPAGT